MELKNVKKILIINLGGIGDILLSLAAVRALCGAYKGAVVDSMVVKRAGGLVESTGFFNEIFLYRGGLSWDLPLFMRLRRKRYDLVINMRTMVGALSAIKVFFLLSAINGRVWAGRDTDGRGGFFHIKIPETLRGDKYETEYDIELAEKLGAKVEYKRMPYKTTPGALKRVHELLKKEAILDGDIVIGIHPGGKPSHRWPLESFAEVMRKVGSAAVCSFVITGDGDETALADRLISASGVKAVNMAGLLSLEESGALIERCSVFITNDTAAMHIAALLKVPLIAIFGPGYLTRFDPRNISKDAVVFYRETACAPCDRKRCGTMECLKAIAPGEVAAAALRLLAKGEMPEFPDKRC